jgi:hypothetical protein
LISRSLLLYLLIAMPTLAMPQMLSEKSALKSIRLARYEKAYQQVRKLLTKDSTNAVAHYLLALYYFSPHNSGFNIDSAAHYTEATWRNFSNAPSKSREKMMRFPLDSTLLTTLRERIDSAAFSRAKRQNTEQSYNFFLERFAGAKAQEEAVALRDEVAFQDAIARNSREGFLYYLDRYPQSKRAPAAKTAYEKLHYQSETRQHRLADYQNFLRRFPESPHREEAILQIFNIQTASGEVHDYQRFVDQFPLHLLSKKAQAIIRYLDVTTTSDSLVFHPEKVLLPVLHDGKFGFINAAGDELVKPAYTDLDPRYRCGNITDELLVLDGQVVSTDGTPFNLGQATDIEPVGNGFWLTTNSQCGSLLHQSGFVVGSDCITDAKIIAGKYLAIQEGSLWTLWAMNGLKLTSSGYAEITSLGDVVMFLKDKKYRLATTLAIAASANQQPLRLSDGFDDFKRWGNGRIWLKAGAFEGVLDQTLNVHIGFEEGPLEETFFGAVRRGSSVQLFNEKGNKTAIVNDFQMQSPWLLGKPSTQWHLLDLATGVAKSPGYDSVSFKGPFVIAYADDTTRVYLDQHCYLDFLPHEHIEFIPGQDSSAFLVVTSGKGKVLYDQRGNKMFTFNADKIQHAGQRYFIITKKEKKGLIGPTGKPLTPVTFDAIGSARNGTFSLLKSMQFGLFSVKGGKLINPEYGKNIVQYNGEVLTGYKQGAWGFIDWQNKPIGKFEFEEIQYWNDSLALVKKDAEWMMMDIKKRLVVFGGIKTVKYIRDSPEEKLVIVNIDGKFGVLSNIKGVVIPINFTDLVNVGSADAPVFFTEKHVEEASVFVVIYYSGAGKFLRKEVYEADDYERIYCSE